MEDKVNPQLAKQHPDFQEILKQLQTDRIKAGKEDSQNKIALWKLTKTISNLIKANKDVWDSLVEVEIDGNKN